jgi:hypothetical protein
LTEKDENPLYSVVSQKLLDENLNLEYFKNKIANVTSQALLMFPLSLFMKDENVT